jgi:hypothetical protein
MRIERTGLNVVGMRQGGSQPHHAFSKAGEATNE